MIISPGDLDDPRIIDLLNLHVTRARTISPPESAHALDLAGLKAPNITFWAAWDGDMLCGVGALKAMTPKHGEIKSMHTAEAARGRGIGAAMLQYIVAAARAHGHCQLSLETGSMAYFDPARALYRRHGFVECPPYGPYRLDPNSVYMTMTI